MAYFRTLSKLQQMLKLFSREERWLILINADPDAMASASALKRIMRYRVRDVAIAKVNTITRPDNLAMVRYTRMHMADYTPAMLQEYDRFAVVDSQPHHHPDFVDVPFSLVIDHHPLPEHPAQVEYFDVRPEYGATSTMMTEYLYNLHLRPAKLLATALQFGIKTDTSNFERHFFDVDLRAYQYLARFADHVILSRIVRSEFHRHWLDHFAKACTNMYGIGSGQYVFIGEVDSTDVLVNIADFFMRVYEIRWVVVSGIHGSTVVSIFRGDGIALDVGAFAIETLGELGSAGGHKNMARAEFSLDALDDQDAELFLWKRLSRHKRTPAKRGQDAEGEPSGGEKRKQTPKVSAEASAQPGKAGKTSP